MSGQVFEGKTVEDALARAAAEMDARVDELEHEVLEEEAEDFWGLDEPTTKIRAWRKGEGEPRAAEAEPEAPESEVREEPAPEAGDRPAAQAAGEAGEPESGRPAAAGGQPAGGGFWGGEEDADASEGPAPPVKPTKSVAEADRAEGGAAAEAAPSEQPEAGARESARPETRETAGPEAQGPADETDREKPREIESVSAEDAPADEFEGLPEEIEDPVPEIRELLARVFEDMSFECEAEIAEDAEQIDVMISGPDKDYLVENSGKGISALELILNHAFRHRLPQGRKIRVDAGDFRSRREEELRDLAFQVAHSAKQSGKTQETQELNPYERRLVHLALADDDEVTTRSRGQGFLKHVQVIPQDRG